MTSTRHLTPVKLRMILLATLALITIGAGAIFYFANTSLKQTATTVSHKVADAEASRSKLDNLKKIEKFLKEQQSTIDRANSIVADSQSYQYQDQIIIDLNTYAEKAGIAITNMDFGGATAAAGTSAPAAATPTPTPAATTGSVNSTSVSITLVNPVDYNSLLRFIKSIEQNLTKMQISKVSLSKATEGNKVSTDTLTIEVYIR